MKKSTVQIEMYSDVVCPWCLVQVGLQKTPVVFTAT